MHRAIEITLPPTSTDALIREPKKSNCLISLAVHRGASIKPSGNVLVVHTLNQDADRILNIADAACEQGTVSVATSELLSIVDPQHERAVVNDIDEAL